MQIARPDSKSPVSFVGTRRQPALGNQRGQALIILLAIVGFASGMFVYSAVSNVSRSNAANKYDAGKMAEVKAALIAWSASRSPTASNTNIRPGELPCPDTDNNGYGEDDNNNDGSIAGETGCAAGAIGRVPWKTLGMPEPKDSSGETLWYAISGNFRVYKSSGGNTYTSPITSDTLGNLTVYQGTSATTATSQAIAVVFAPRIAIGTQDRNSATTALCATTGTTIAKNLCATNYLESISGGNNAQTGGPFIRTTSGDTFNDSLLYIPNSDLMPIVERRVAREMMAILEQYRLAQGFYPWADLADGNSNGSSGNYYNHPRFPCGTALPADWGSGGTPNLPNWLTNGCGALTGWNGVIFYSVGKNRLEGAGVNCTTCNGATLTVTNASSLSAELCPKGASPFMCSSSTVSTGNTDLLLITPGAASSNRAAGWPSSFSTIVGYFDDATNADNNSDSFVVPSATTYDRDRIFIVR